MNILDAVPKYVWAALVVALAATSCKLKFDKDGLSIEIEKTRTQLAETKADFSAAVTAANIALAEQTEEYRNTEQTLLAKAAAERAKSDEAVKGYERVVATLTRRLRDTSAAKTAAASNPSTPTVASVETFAAGTIGYVISGEAEFLVGEALRADTVRQELLTCRADYESARQAMAKFKSESQQTQTSQPSPSASPE